MGKTPDNRGSFKTSCIKAAAGAPDALIIVDVQDGTLEFMSPDDQKNYLERLGTEIKHFRSENRPVIWVTIGDKEAHYVGDRHADDRVDMQTLRRLDFCNPYDEQFPASRKITRQFFEQHGPLMNESIFQKKEFDAFSVQGFAHDLKQVKNPMIVGAVSNACVLFTARGAALRDMQPTIGSHLVVSWVRNEGMFANPDRHLFWHEGHETELSAVAAHEAMIKETLSGEVTLAEISRYTASRIGFPSSGKVLDAPVLNKPALSPQHS